MTSIRRELPGLLKLSWPLILSQLAQVGIIFTDVIMMGILGSEALAGAGLGGSVFSFFLMFSFGTITVITNLVASHIHDKPMIKHIVHAGLWVATLLFMIFGFLLWNIKPILILLGQLPIVVDTATLYLSALIWGMLPNLLFSVLRAFTIGIMQPQLITAISVGAMVMNVLLNLLFINLFPSLGVINLGLASSLVFLMMFITLVCCILFNTRLNIYFVLRDFKFFYPKLIVKIIQLGFPMGMIFTFEGGFFVLSAFMVGWFGVASLAAHTIAMQLSFLVYMVSIAIANATSILISTAYGRQHFNRIHVLGRTGILVVLIWTGIAGLFYWFWPEPFIYLFTYYNNQEMGEIFYITTRLLMIAAVFQIFDAMQAMMFGILRGIEEGLKPMLIAIVGYWCIGAPMAYVFSIIWGQEAIGVWLGLATGLAVTGLLGWIFFEIKMAQLNRTKQAAT